MNFNILKANPNGNLSQQRCFDKSSPKHNCEVPRPSGLSSWIIISLPWIKKITSHIERVQRDTGQMFRVTPVNVNWQFVGTRCAPRINDSTFSAADRVSISHVFFLFSFLQLYT